MIKTIKVKIKSKDEIINTLKSVDYADGDVYGTLVNDENKGELKFSDMLWDFCGKEIEVIDCKSHSHQYDYYYFDYKENETTTNVIYFVDDWIELADEHTKQLDLFGDTNGN